MKTNSELRRDVERELVWDPSIDARSIGVAAKNGVVTLTGYVSSYSDKWQAERIAKRVAGVTALANDIEARAIRRAWANGRSWTYSGCLGRRD